MPVYSLEMFYKVCLYDDSVVVYSLFVVAPRVWRFSVVAFFVVWFMEHVLV